MNRVTLWTGINDLKGWKVTAEEISPGRWEGLIIDNTQSIQCSWDAGFDGPDAAGRGVAHHWCELVRPTPQGDFFKTFSRWAAEVIFKHLHGKI